MVYEREEYSISESAGILSHSIGLIDAQDNLDSAALEVLFTESKVAQGGDGHSAAELYIFNELKWYVTCFLMFA